MSNALAIAAVSSVIKQLLDNALSQQPGSAAFGGQIQVSAVAPDRIKQAEGDGVRLNLFLYQVVPNSGWRNVGLPSSDARGDPVTNPPLALDLCYLLTAYGQQDLEAEILLGYAMQVLHENPVLPRELIRRSLNPVGGAPPPAVVALTGSDLADQVEMIKISPSYLTTEESSKLWAAFQVGYRPSVAYHASVVLIEGRKPTRAALPVLTRGPLDLVTGRDRGIAVQSDLQPPFPTLDGLVPPNLQPSVRLGELFQGLGHHLAGDEVVIRFRHARTAQLLELPVVETSASGFQVQVPPDPPVNPPPAADSPRHPDQWQAGVYGVSAVVKQSGIQHVSNELPLVLAPTATVSRTVNGANVELTASVKPKVRKSQRAVLILGDREIPAEPFAADATSTVTFKTKVAALPPDPLWFRLRVDGIESILVDRRNPPKFDPTQKVTP